MQHVSYKNRLKELGLLSLKHLWENLLAGYQYKETAYEKEAEQLFTKACSNKTRRNGSKLKDSGFRLDIGYIKKFFTVKMVRHSKRFPSGNPCGCPPTP